MNRCFLHGNVGKDPDVRTLESGNKVAKFSLATNKVYKNSSGEKVTETQWHNILVWNKLADLCEKYITKGSSVIIEGEISYRTYENKDGITVYMTEINGNALHGEWKKGEKRAVKSMSDPDELPGYVNSGDVPDDELPY